MTAPKRIQRKRTKGWRMPEGAVYVGHPGRFGNPYVVGGINPFTLRKIETNAESVDTYRAARQSWNHDYLMRWLAPLRGHDLACWCPLDQPCHADVLLELANR